MEPQFGATTTTDEVLEGVDLAGRRVLVTGTSAGLGIETARAIVAHGGHVVGTVRDLAKAERAWAPVAPDGPGSIEFVALDLASLASVRAGADGLLARGERFDVVVGNAGIMACPFARTADGFERQFGVNHLGHFVLVNRLAPLIADGGRVVMLSSRGHRVADVDLDDPGFDRGDYDPIVAYGRSKTANALFAVGFDRRHRGRGIRATSLHPGGIHTELMRYMTPETRDRLVRIATSMPSLSGSNRQGLKTVAQGAATTAWAAFVAPADAVGGRYCTDCRVAAVADDAGDGRGEVMPYALDPDRADALWALSERLSGERPDAG